ncbi:MAG TPA: glucosamine-6-phosphate deaminase [Vicinamibacterales bacterium]|jgi:glucosamine-6-phosphate deaminase|nr:glucosamine-6-phosphate deaminase [Vicinamibacterales bacterium]
MRIVIVENPETLAVAAADVVASVVRARPDAILGLPSGETPLGLYRELGRRVDAGDLDLSRVTAFAVDEFYGAPAGAPGTNAAYFAARLTFRLRALHLLRSDAPDPEAECARFAAILRELGPPDLVVLGIGADGHIAFNEPGSPPDSRTRLVALTDETRRAHAEAFGGLERVPRTGLTIGIADILEARRVLLLASGGAKAGILARALRGPETPEVPASALRRHPALTVIADRAAAADLQRYEGARPNA